MVQELSLCKIVSFWLRLWYYSNLNLLCYQDDSIQHEMKICIELNMLLQSAFKADKMNKWKFFYSFLLLSIRIYVVYSNKNNNNINTSLQP